VNTPLPAAKAWQHSIEQKRLELKRMRIYAAALLLFMLAIYLLTGFWLNAYPWLAYPRAFAEAAMVGACADWFAVVALFRHPFGIPIPHTAVVPRHKNRIGENLGHFISNNFLAPAELTARMERVDASGWVSQWLSDPDNVRHLAGRLQTLFPPLLDLFSIEQLQQFSRDLIRKGIDSVAAAPLMARLLSVLIKHGYHNQIFDAALDRALEFYSSRKDSIHKRVQQSADSWMSNWVDSKITDAFLVELLASIKAAKRNPDHPWRHEYQNLSAKLVGSLANDEELFEKLEQIKSEFLDNKIVEGYLNWLGKELEVKLQDELNAPDGLLASGLERALLALGKWLNHDANTRTLVNRWAQQLVLTTIVPNREEISVFVADVVARWDTATLVDKLELQFGKDLQYIRINGTLVGGCVGLLIFVAGQLASAAHG
jgi:uncharacterized membrane-anchored protein YjiN (DUF445 family)